MVEMSNIGSSTMIVGDGCGREIFALFFFAFDRRDFFVFSGDFFASSSLLDCIEADGSSRLVVNRSCSSSDT